ncbi:MAG: tRNA (guanosine(46)-N7)-methyltransferase TrmB [Lachnospiraceae bacterium]|nr:tRNA (guanosine(46)-N7)-methyltransferase TrmB [Lachnospiraceae bacterium]
MRLRNVKGAKEAVEASPFCENTPEIRRGHWQEFFGRRGPLHLEIGCGKGRFLAEMAERYPEIDFLGIEKYTSVLYRALQKQEERQLPNLRFARMDAEILPLVFAPGEVSHIYLNFSDPWPKERHAGKRLPSADFLRRYEEVLVPYGQVAFKTDNEALFDFALSELVSAGWEAGIISRDLHADEELMRDNCMTEYEERFSAKGNPIFYALIHKKKGEQRWNMCLQPPISRRRS